MKKYMLSPFLLFAFLLPTISWLSLTITSLANTREQSDNEWTLIVAIHQQNAFELLPGDEWPLIYGGGEMAIPTSLSRLFALISPMSQATALFTYVPLFIRLSFLTPQTL
jgi:hypothetical protein